MVTKCHLALEIGKKDPRGKKNTVRAPVFGRHQFFGTLEHYGKTHGSLLSRWMNYNYTACCWFPTSSNISIHPSLFWQIRFESYWFPCSKCRILVLTFTQCSDCGVEPHMRSQTRLVPLSVNANHLPQLRGLTCLLCSSNFVGFDSAFVVCVNRKPGLPPQYMEQAKFLTWACSLCPTCGVCSLSGITE